MKPGEPIADLIFGYLLDGTARAYGSILDCDEASLRRAIAALSTFSGPGTFARDLAIQMIRDDLAERERHD